MASRNISLSDALLAEVEAVAQAEHRSVEDVFRDAVKRYLDDCSWVNLLGYGRERAKALGIEESDIERLIAESRAEQRQR